MASLLRSALIFGFVSSLLVLSVPACSEQAEGERCDRAKAGDTDCDAGLTCVAEGELLVKGADRCCPPEGQETSDRCVRGSASGSTAGTSNGGSNSSGSNAGGNAGESAGGSSAGIGGNDTGNAGEPATGGTPSTEGGASGAAGSESSAGASLGGAGQGGGTP